MDNGDQRKRPDIESGPHDHHEGHVHTHTNFVINHLSQTIDHFAATRNMVSQGCDCSEVLAHLAAVRSAINTICELILKDHLEHCITDAAKNGDMEAFEKLRRAVELLIK